MSSIDTTDRARLTRIMPELPVRDVAGGVAYYCGALGFGINHQQDDIAVLDRDAVRVLLVRGSEEHAGFGSCYVYVDDADALHAELRASGARMEGEPISRPWGLREFSVTDLQGNRLTFGQPLW